MYRVRRAASPSWSISHPSLTGGGEGKSSNYLLPPAPDPLLPGGLSLLHVPPALPFVIRGGLCQGCCGDRWRTLAPGMAGCKQHISEWPWRWSPHWSQQCGGLGWHKHGDCPHHPWGCTLPRRHWERGGQEQISAFVLGPASRLEYLCAPSR